MRPLADRAGVELSTDISGMVQQVKVIDNQQVAKGDVLFELDPKPYRFALERGSLDTMLRDWVARPFMRLFERLDRVDRAWTLFLSGGKATREEERR